MGMSGTWADGLDFSRDGQWVTYITRPEAVLWRNKLDGSERLRLTTPSLDAATPRWSPDGKRIAFAAWKAGKGYGIYVVSAEGGIPQELVTDEHLVIDPTWSPDGDSLAFGQDPWVQLSNINLRILDVTSRQGCEPCLALTTFVHRAGHPTDATLQQSRGRRSD